MSTIYGTPIDVIAEGVLREDGLWEVKQLMAQVKAVQLTACELLAILAIMRSAKERLDAQHRAPAPVLQLIPI
jgi:negative regulator of sigma E activity